MSEEFDKLKNQVDELELLIKGLAESISDYQEDQADQLTDLVEHFADTIEPQIERVVRRVLSE